MSEQESAKCQLCKKIFKNTTGLKIHARSCKQSIPVIIEEEKSPNITFEKLQPIEIIQLPKIRDVCSTCKTPCQQCNKPTLIPTINTTPIQMQTAPFATIHEFDRIKNNLVDMWIGIEKQLFARVDTGITLNISKIPLLNEYEKVLIDPLQRIKPVNDIKLFKSRSWNDFPYNYRDQPTIYSTQKSEIAIAKLCIENNIKFTRPKIPMRYIDFDIETCKRNTSIHQSKIPMHEDSHAFIAMICFSETIDDKTTFFAYILDIYQFDESIIRQKLQQTDSKIVVLRFEDDFTMSRAFLEYINDTEFLTIAQSFNGSCSKQRSKSYDLPWICNRAGISEKYFNGGSSKWFTGREETITRIDGFHNVIFVDAKQLIFDDLCVLQADHHLQNYSLDDILEFTLGNQYKKLAHNYQEMNTRLQLNGSDISDIIAYCIYDSFALRLMQNKFNSISGLEQQSLELNIPITSVFKCSMAKQLTMYLFSIAYNEKYGFFYGYFNYQESRAMHGAYTKAPSARFLYQPLKIVATDFVSQYPNSMIQYNLSPETFVHEQTDYCVDINYLKGDPILCYFSNNRQGIFPRVAEHFFNIKSASKKGTTKYAVAKRCANSIYGISNQQSSPFYQYECGQAITGFCRMTTHMIERMFQEQAIQPLSIDTDGIEVLIQDESDIAKIHEVSSRINDIYPRMVLEIDKPCYAVFSPGKKQYLLLKNDKITIKGVGSSSRLTKFCQQQQINFFKSLIDPTKIKRHEITAIPYDQNINQNNENQQIQKTELFDIAENYIQSLQHNLENIKTPEDFQKYTIKVRNTKQYSKLGHLTKAGYLERQYGQQDVYQVVPYNQNQPRKDHNFAIIDQSFDITRVNTSELTAMITQQIRTFFQLKNNKKSAFYAKQRSGEILVRIEHKKGQESQSMSIEQLQEEIQKYGDYKTYHESIHQQVCRAYFDVDADSSIDNHVLFQTLQKLLNSNDYAFATAHSIKDGVIQKSSYHIIFNALYSIKQIKILAQIANKQLINQGYSPVIDIQTYSKNHDMRLPGCIKTVKGQIINRKFQIQRGTFEDMIITSKNARTIDFSETIAFDSDLHWGGFENNLYTSESKQRVVNWLKHTHKLDVKITNESRIEVLNCPYTCPCCQSVHHQQGLYLAGKKRLGCWSCIQQADKKQIQLPIDLHLEQLNVPEYKFEPLHDAFVINQRDINFSLNKARLTFVRSAMGTSKTKCLIKQFQNYDRVLVISFRRTFAQEFASKSGIANYMDLDSLNFDINPQICVQIDSLYRLKQITNNSGNNLLVLDEFESILNHARGFIQKPHMQLSIKILFEALKNFKNICVMDAFLQQKSIDLVKKISEVDNAFIYDNQYQPMLDSTINMIQCSKALAKNRLFEQVKSAIEQGKRVYSFVTSQSVGNDLCIYIQEQFPSKRIVFFHGKNSLCDNQDKTKEMQLHKTFKETLLQDINNNMDGVDLWVCTSTIIAGISFERKNFDIGIHLFAKETVESLSFVQGIQRVRDISTKHHTIILENALDINKGHGIPSQIAETQFEQIDYLPKHEQYSELAIYLEARYNAINARNTAILQKFLTSQGYSITFEAQHDKCKIIKQTHNQLEQCQLNEEDAKFLTMSEKQSDQLRGDDAKYFYTKRRLLKIASYFNKPISWINSFDYETRQQISDNLQELHYRHMIDAIKQQTQDDITLENITHKYRQIIKTREKYEANDQILKLNTEQTIKLIRDQMIIQNELFPLINDAKKLKDKCKQLGYGTMKKVNGILATIDIEIISKKSNNITRYSIKRKQSDNATLYMKLFV